MKHISALGSTGSIGQNTLEIVRRYPDQFKIVGLTARGRIDLLQEQINTFKPRAVAVFDEAKAKELRKSNASIEILSGLEGLLQVATLPEADTVVSAIVGSYGLLPTYAAVQAGKNVALANKEAMVMAGPIILQAAQASGATIVPVDSEHSAIFQCLNGESKDEISRVILTASGGPFLKKSLEELASASPEDALKHPNWSMGQKVTIDSATLMNKGLEVIEAKWLFDLPTHKIDVYLHPQSIVHSMVEFVDGSIIAQMSIPDMKGPICYALSYPKRFDNVMPAIKIEAMSDLHFERPNTDKFPCLNLAYEALNVGGTMPAVLNAANEIAVDAFLNYQIPFLKIHQVVSDTMSAHPVAPCDSIDRVIGSAQWAKQKATDFI
jgi:1-deoxy-D-xylulose-5-phosphate reductoisomerase